MPADEGERWRVFLAVEVPGPVRDALSGPLRALEPLREVVRINAIDRIHLTLHFLGQLSRRDVEALQVAVARAVVRHPPFGVVVEGVGAFPDIRRPRVLWAGVGGADLPKLIVLQADLGDALRAAGLTVEDRFQPHLTLARVVRPPNAAERALLREWSTAWLGKGFGDVPVEHVNLMRSQLGGGPARYTTLATFDLQ
jgi:2'-5' RNA ligase